MRVGLAVVEAPLLFAVRGPVSPLLTVAKAGLALDRVHVFSRDDRAAIAKENNNKLKLWKQVLQRNPPKKVGIIQSGKNKAYTISNTLGRALL